MRRAYCTNEMCDGRWKFETNIHNLRNPKKTAHEKLKEEEGDFFWRSIEEGGVPNCSKCGSVVRPDIVLFGEVSLSLSLSLFFLVLSLFPAPPPFLCSNPTQRFSEL